MFAAADVDVVYIATPPFLHFELLHAANRAVGTRVRSRLEWYHSRCKIISLQEGWTAPKFA
jgi:hypothetical protein